MKIPDIFTIIAYGNRGFNLCMEVETLSKWVLKNEIEVFKECYLLIVVCNENMTRCMRVRSARLIRQVINRAARRLRRDDSRH